MSSAHNSAGFLSCSMTPPACASVGSVSCKQCSGAQSSVQEHWADADITCYMHFVWQADLSPVSASNVRHATETDSVLSQVVRFVLKGRPEKTTDKNIKPYFNCSCCSD